MEAGPSTLFGDGWRHVENFDDLDDLDEYETDEEETYVTLDLGDTLDSRFIAQSGDYQLIGLDSPSPFIRVGQQVFQGQVEEMMGSEIIYGQIRDPTNPHNTHHPARHIVNHRIGFQPVTLQERVAGNKDDTLGADDDPILGTPSTASDALLKVKRGRPKGVKSKAKDGEGGTMLHGSDTGDGTGSDFFMREAERELINSAKARGEEPMKRTRGRGGETGGAGRGGKASSKDAQEDDSKAGSDTSPLRSELDVSE